MQRDPQVRPPARLAPRAARRAGGNPTASADSSRVTVSAAGTRSGPRARRPCPLASPARPRADACSAARTALPGKASRTSCSRSDSTSQMLLLGAGHRERLVARSPCRRRSRCASRSRPSRPGRPARASAPPAARRFLGASRVTAGPSWSGQYSTTSPAPARARSTSATCLRLGAVVEDVLAAVDEAEDGDQRDHAAEQLRRGEAQCADGRQQQERDERDGGVAVGVRGVEDLPGDAPRRSACRWSGRTASCPG